MQNNFKNTFTNNFTLSALALALMAGNPSGLWAQSAQTTGYEPLVSSQRSPWAPDSAPAVMPPRRH